MQQCALDKDQKQKHPHQTRNSERTKTRKSLQRRCFFVCLINTQPELRGVNSKKRRGKKKKVKSFRKTTNHQSYTLCERNKKNRQVRRRGQRASRKTRQKRRLYRESIYFSRRKETCMNNMRDQPGRGLRRYSQRRPKHHKTNKKDNKGLRAWGSGIAQR